MSYAVAFGLWIAFGFVSILLLLVLLLILTNLELATRNRSLESKYHWQQLEHESVLASQEQLLQHLEEQKQLAIDKAKAGLRSQFKGLVAERLYPVLPGCSYDPRDMVFVSDPVDYVVFDGLAEGDLRKIVILEIKSGKSKKSSRQNQIQKVIEQGALEFRLLKLLDPLEAVDGDQPPGTTTVCEHPIPTGSQHDQDPVRVHIQDGEDQVPTAGS